MMNMNRDPLEQRLVDAENNLHAAMQKLSQLRRLALYGAYDATEFDQAVQANLAAETEVIAARRAYENRHVIPAPVAITEPMLTPEDINLPVAEATPRLLFARWLVQTGRLSDWNVAAA